MTEQQAIKILQEEKSWESDDRKIDAFIMAIEALEKQIKKNPAIDHNKGGFIRKKCVVCGNIVMPFDGKYCAECGQRLE